jgi:hypothetical protein
MLLPQTRDYISNLSDQDLINYLAEGIYEPDAIAFAQEEMARRNLDSQKLGELQAAAYTHVAKQADNLEAVAAKRLGIVHRLLAMLLGAFILGLFPIMIYVIWRDGLRDRGEWRKTRDLNFFVIAGFITAIVLVVASAFLSKR